MCANLMIFDGVFTRRPVDSKYPAGLQFISLKLPLKRTKIRKFASKQIIHNEQKY